MALLYFDCAAHFALGVHRALKQRYNVSADTAGGSV
jgi:hypothetical protein